MFLSSNYSKNASLTQTACAAYGSGAALAAPTSQTIQDLLTTLNTVAAADYWIGLDDQYVLTPQLNITNVLTTGQLKAPSLSLMGQPSPRLGVNLAPRI